jgi:hypothetical protein
MSEEWGRIVQFRPAIADRFQVEDRIDDAEAGTDVEDRIFDEEAGIDRMRDGIESALDWHREHPGSDHVDAAYAAAGHAGELGHSRWPEFVTAVRESVEAADVWRQAGMEAER